MPLPGVLPVVLVDMPPPAPLWLGRGEDADAADMELTLSAGCLASSLLVLEVMLVCLKEMPLLDLADSRQFRLTNFETIDSTKMINYQLSAYVKLMQKKSPLSNKKKGDKISDFSKILVQAVQAMHHGVRFKIRPVNRGPPCKCDGRRM